MIWNTTVKDVKYLRWLVNTFSSWKEAFSEAEENLKNWLDGHGATWTDSIVIL